MRAAFMVFQDVITEFLVILLLRPDATLISALSDTICTNARLNEAKFE